MGIFVLSPSLSVVERLKKLSEIGLEDVEL